MSESPLKALTVEKSFQLMEIREHSEFSAIRYLIRITKS
jgi:hypothetical protein